MRLLVFCAYFWPHKGGHEKYVEEVCSRLSKRGWKIDIVTSLLPGTKTVERYRGLRIYRVPIWHFSFVTCPLPKPGVMKSLLGRLAENGYDCAMTNTRLFPASWWGAWFSRRYGVPLLHIEHGTQHPAFSNPLFRLLAGILDHTFGVYVLKRAKVVGGVSNAAERFVQHLCRRNTVLLPNAVDTSFFKPKTQKHERTITFVGRLIAAKGVQDLFAATQGMPVRVLVVGGGPYGDHLRGIAGPNVKFLGEKDSQGVREALSETDIFVNPSYAEGLPTCVLEAGAMGLPVIATDVGGTREIIDDGVNGFLIKPKDVEVLREKLAVLLKKPSLREQFGKRLQEKVRERYDWSGTARKISEVLKRL